MWNDRHDVINIAMTSYYRKRTKRNILSVCFIHMEAYLGRERKMHGNRSFSVQYSSLSADREFIFDLIRAVITLSIEVTVCIVTWRSA